MKNILIADTDSTFTSNMKKELQHINKLADIKTVTNGKECLDYLKNHQIDLLILDLFLPFVDGFTIIKEIKQRNIPIGTIICTTNILDNHIYRLLQDNGIYGCLKKPIDPKFLMAYISNLTSTPNQQAILENEVTKLLHQLGMPANVKGYNYLRCAILIAYKNPDISGQVTKFLYPEVARTFHTTSTRVERAMRHAIIIAWTRGNPMVIEEIFKNTIAYNKDKPTNSEFIALLADRLRLTFRNTNID